MGPHEVGLGGGAPRGFANLSITLINLFCRQAPWPEMAVVELVLVAAFVVTLLITPWISRHLVKIGIAGVDMHKRNKPRLAEMGGLSIVAGFTAAMLAAIVATRGLNLVDLFAAMTTILIIAIIGVGDDLFQLRQDVKAVLPVLAALPLMAILAGEHAMALPIIGIVDFGVFYPLLLVPIGITGASNALNMLAGLNGLEAGSGIIMHATVLTSALLIKSQEPSAIYAAVISAAMLGALLAFYYYNRFPARVFPGDVGTLTIGASLAVSVILGNMEKIGLILILPYFAELYLKARCRFRGQSFGTLRYDGTLAPPKKVCSLTHVVMGLGRLTERKIVAVLLGIEAVFAMLALFSVYATYFAPGLIR